MNLTNCSEHVCWVRVSLDRYDSALLCKPIAIKLKPLSPKLIRKHDKQFYYQHFDDCAKTNTHSQHSNNARKSLVGASRTRLWCGHGFNSNEFYKRFESRFKIDSQTNAHRICDREEPEVSNANINQHMRYLDLFSTNELKRSPNEVNNFPIRGISRCDSIVVKTGANSSVEFDKKRILRDIFRSYSKKIASNKYQDIKPKKKRFCYNIVRKYKLLNERKRQQSNKSNQLLQHENYQKHNKLLSNELVKYVSRTSFSSPLGQRLNIAIKDQYNELNDFRQNISSSQSYEPFCFTMKRYFKSSNNINKFNDWNCSTIEKLCFNSDVTPNRSLKYTHKYSFNRRQRLEKLLRFETGLDYRSRLLALRCKPSKVNAMRGYCVICNLIFFDEHICPKNRVRPPISNESSQQRLVPNLADTDSIHFQTSDINNDNCAKNDEQLKKKAKDNFNETVIIVNKFDVNLLPKTCNINVDNDKIKHNLYH